MLFLHFGLVELLVIGAPRRRVALVGIARLRGTIRGVSGVQAVLLVRGAVFNRALGMQVTSAALINTTTRRFVGI